MASKYYLGLDAGSISLNVVLLDSGKAIIDESYTRIKGKPVQTAKRVLEALFEKVPVEEIETVAATGSGGRLIARLLGIEFINEIVAQARAEEELHPEVRTIIEIGGEDSKLIWLETDPDSDRIVVRDFAMNTVCAAGTGSFLDQQASRLGLSIEKEFGELALKSENPPRVAGRCSVFAKSDMIHLQQQATPDYDIVAGLCYAMARNVKSNLATGKEIEKPVAFQGGVAANQGLVRAFEDVLEVGRGNLIVPKHHTSMGAIGAILTALDQGTDSRITDLTAFDAHLKDLAGKKVGQRLDPLTFEGDTSKRHYVSIPSDKTSPRTEDGLIPAYLGIDVGSISTNVVALDKNRNLLAKSYLMTAGRPLEAVQQGLREVGGKVADKVNILGVCTTGSGRYLTGDFVGADCVRNEITAQATGAISIDPGVDTIFEIGGQDSKYISIDNGVVVDFEMNHVCAAGTGSFLEEQAEKLGINIKGEFGGLALQCESPVKLGERCTVFMESNLVHCQQNGAAVDELVSGLSYSIVYNYLNRVVAHRRRGNRIFFQGGTAANKGVVAAFEKVTGQPIIVPEHHDVTGAIGAAILAQEYQKAEGRTESTFRGFDLSNRNYTIRPFECEDCPNNCEIKEVTIEGEDPLYYGSRCDKYNLKKEEKHADIPDLFKQREKLLVEGYKPPKKDSGRKVVGIPRALFMHQQFPYWHGFFKALGLDVLLSPVSNNKLIRTGVETVVSETCFPCKVMHGHVLHLLDKDVDFLFVPSLINLHREVEEQENNYVCPYVQTIPYTLQSAFEFENHDTTLLRPVLHFERGEKAIYKALCTMAGTLRVTKGQIRQAMAAGHEAQSHFEDGIRDIGRRALASIPEGQQTMVVLSRPYNGCDAGINLRLPHKLRDLGVLAIPMDFLPLHDIDDYEEWENMFWKYGQNILRAAEIVKRDKRLNAVYISNFGCGPDSFISSFVKAVLEDQPLLQLEIDEHSADAGVITRCEAYLDSVKNVEPTAAKSVDVIPKAFSDGDSRTLMIPQMGLHAFPLAAAFRGSGMDAQVIPMSDAESLEYGRRYTLGKECLPCIVTTGDMLKIIDQSNFDPDKIAFFMPSGSGPCRFGQYCNLHRLVLKRAGFPEIPVIAPNQGKSFYDDFKQLKKDPTRPAWQGIVVADVLHKALHATRPYETTPGATDKVFQECLDKTCEILETGGDVFVAMPDFAEKFKAIDVDRSQARPVIGIVGEIYVRSHSFCNQDIVRRLEALGAEVKLASTSEWIYYTNYCRVRRGWIEGDYRTAIGSSIKDFFQKRDEKRAAKPFVDAFDDVLEVKTRTLLGLSNPYIHDTYEGEAVLSIGKTVELFHQNAHGVVNVLPFTCMPGTIVSAVLKWLRRDCGNFPTLSIAYDGQEQANLATRLEAFVHQCRQYMENTAHKSAH